MTRTSATGVPDAGFTLIELMVVLVIVGIALAAVTLSFRSPTQQPLGREGERLVAVLNLAKDEARLTGQPVLLKLDRQGWRFFQAGPAGWVAVPDDQLPSGQFNPLLDRVVFGSAADPSTSEMIQYWIGIEEIDDFKGLRLQRGSQQVQLMTDGLGHYGVVQVVP
ncbi:MAG: type II secretion system minor pseudopilin GspH [Burkholderiales bacterium]